VYSDAGISTGLPITQLYRDTDIPVATAEDPNKSQTVVIEGPQRTAIMHNVSNITAEPHAGPITLTTVSILGV
jgi:hypothetical protein